jgi:hypothetical protein
MSTPHVFDSFLKKDYQVTCPFCSIGCRFKILKGLDEVIYSSKTQDVLDFDYVTPLNQGALCPRGHFAYELLSHPVRLGRSFDRKNGHLEPETPELIFHAMVENMKKNKNIAPLAILINPMISLHDIRAMLDFARNNKIEAIDFVAPMDRHLFRALLDTPFIHHKCDDNRVLQNLTYTLSIGDLFTKQPILSRHLLKAKYALRKNAFFSLNPIPSRTSWFSNIHLENNPHTEPLHLFYMFYKIYELKKNEMLQSELTTLAKMYQEKIEPLLDFYLQPHMRDSLDNISNMLGSTKNSAIFFSTHHYNLLGSYISGILCSAISALTDNYFIPLYSDGNFNAIEELSRDIYPSLKIGCKPMLHLLTSSPFQYLFAVGWNPETYIPGNISFHENAKWIISSMIQDRYPAKTFALLPEAHFYEKMDLRTNFISWQSIGSEQVTSPIGAAQSLAHFTYQLHQQAAEEHVNFEISNLPRYTQDWEENLDEEISYYLEKLKEITVEEGIWLIPAEHIAHYKDAQLTRHSSWAKKDCIDEQFSIPLSLSQNMKLKNKQYYHVNYHRNQLPFRVHIHSQLPDDRIIAYGHYPAVRRILPSEFAAHNKEYYFWCPKINIQ